ncbi:lysyl oxidase homolog 3-like isoform X2 [Gordionus sp. m RMFG-2023]|uniref:lysyl oxidase homolog 3-like isoform X2 n=1 Tax=Gordionus sp. m RMFG-2023 TaxID=3053472 RepID=UPI0031FC7F04
MTLNLIGNLSTNNNYPHEPTPINSMAFRSDGDVLILYDRIKISKSHKRSTTFSNKMNHSQSTSSLPHKYSPHSLFLPYITNTMTQFISFLCTLAHITRTHMKYNATPSCTVLLNKNLFLLLIVNALSITYIFAQGDRSEYSRNNRGPGSYFRPQISEGFSNIESNDVQGSEGGIRLTGSRSQYSGNLEVYHMGRWGSICDDDWDIKEATVVCRQLGYPSARRATHDSEFGKASERYWLDNVNCQGNENFIHECSSNGWGLHDCSIAEAAGVECVNYPTESHNTNNDGRVVTPRISSASRGHLGLNDEGSGDNDFAHAPRRRISDIVRDRTQMKIRLVGGRSSSHEGRVEVDMFGNNRWGLICGDGWMLMEANVTCTQLGFGFAKAAPQTHVFGGRREDIILNGVTCRGTERDLSECEFKEVAESNLQCPGGNDFAGVVCGEGLPDLVPDPELLKSTAYIEDRQMFFLRCAMEENCLARTAYALDSTDYMWPYMTRRLLRFTSRIVNLGTSDFRPHLPKYLWEWHSCHMHYHSMDVFSHYDLTDRRGRKVAQGHKASFCLEDNECSGNSRHKYRCQNFGDQGISTGCSDVYEHNIDCQWIDITDVNPGFYYFKVTINPEFKVAEMSFSNNAIRCDLLYTGLYVNVDNCTLGAP